MSPTIWDAEGTAAFIVSAFEGAMSLAKAAQNPRVMSQVLDGLQRYLASLSTAPSGSVMVRTETGSTR